MENQKLPIESKSQQIGQHAILAFYISHPTSWRPTPTDGDSDAGLDFQVQVVDHGHYRHVFNAQVKGSAQKKNGLNKKLSADGGYFSQSLEITTLNYYLNIGNPVMLIFADLSHDDNPRSCPVYFLWIDEEIEQLRDGKQNLNHLGKNSHTFHIPVENILDSDLGILRYLNHRVEKINALSGIYNIIDKKFSNPIEKINQLRGVFDSNSLAIDTVLDKSENPWFDAPEDSYAGKLKKISELLFLNNADLAQAELEKIKEEFNEFNDHEKSEYFYQSAYLMELLGNRLESISLHEKAHFLSKKIKKYHIACLTARLHNAIDKHHELDKILEEIPEQNDLDYLRLKSKILALKGNFKAALNTIANEDGKNIFILKVLISFLSKDYDSCIKRAQVAIQKYRPNTRQELTLRTLIARAFFQLGLNESDPFKIIPFSGIPSMDPKILKKAWIEISSAWDLASKLGYPPDIDIMVDIFVIVGMYFSESKIIISHLKKLIKLRPDIQIIKEALFQIVMQTNDEETAEQLLSQMSNTLENSINKILLASRKNDKAKIVEIADSILEDLIVKKPINYDITIAVAAECANELLMYDERDKFLEVLMKLPDAKALKAVYNFISQVNQNALKKPQAIDNLYNFYKEGNKHYQILLQLYNNLNPYEEQSAKRLISISNDILTSRDLFAEEYVTLCQAKSTLNDWEGLLKTSQKAQLRFNFNPKFRTFEAMAYDEIGETGKALRILEEITEGKTYDRVAYEVYVNISARCGLIKKAKILTRTLFEKASQRKEKTHLLRMLFNIEKYIDSISKNLLEICLRYGQICDQNDESEEGIFLIQFTEATINPELEVDDTDIKNFQNRLMKFTKKFPESKLLKSFSTSENTPPQEFLKQIESIVGLSEEKKQWYRKNENLLKNSNFPVPYLMRHKFLSNVSNFIQLWEFSKVYGKEFSQYHLTINSGNYIYRETEDFNGRIPLIDELALVVLYELNLIQEVFKLFGKVVIAKDTIMNLQSLAQGFTQLSYNMIAKNIIELLSKQIDFIEQPSCRIENDKNKTFSNLDKIKSVYDSKKHLFYTDDFLGRLYVCGDDHVQNTITTVDIISLLKTHQQMSNKIAAEKFSRLCALNVYGIPIMYQDILYVLSDDLPEKETIKNYVEILESHQNFNNFINLLWWFKSDYRKALREIGQFIKFMLLETEGIKVERNIITAIWYYWFKKVQFIKDSENQKLYFLIRSFLSISISISKEIDLPNKKQIWTKVWSIYDDLINFTYGNLMSRSIENQSRSELANMVATFEIESKQNIYNSIVTGLITGTSERELFDTTYTNKLINNQTKKPFNTNTV
jgi:hypothetical protein